MCVLLTDIATNILNYRIEVKNKGKVKFYIQRDSQ